MITGTIENFISRLTGASGAEVQGYILELEQNRAFRDGLDKNIHSFGRTSFSLNYSVGEQLGTMLYAICRKRQPDIVLETGVGSGVSSSYILCALEQNGRGRLFSIDVPWWREEQSGWLIPDHLLHRWDLHRGRSSEELVPLVEKLAVIDVFLHDSEHSYRNMMWEFRTAWAYLKNGGLLLSHNIDDSDAFPDFCRERGVEGHVLGKMGGAVRP